MALYKLQQLPEALREFLTNEPTPQQFLDVGSVVAQSDLKPKATRAGRIHLGKDQVPAFEDAVIRSLAADDGRSEIAAATQESFQAAFRVLSSMNMLRKCIEGSRSIDPGPRAEAYREVENLMRGEVATLVDGLSVAAVVGLHAFAFDHKIIPLSVDETMTPEERLEKLQEFMQEAEQQEEVAESYVTRLHNGRENYVTLYNSLSNKHYQYFPPDDYCEIKPESRSLASLLPKVSLGSAVTAHLVSQTGRLAAFAHISGLIALETPESLDLALSVAVASCQDMKPSSAGVLEVECADMDDVIKYSASLKAFWSYTASDLRQIQEWLRKGAKRPEMPNYVKLYLDKGVRSYQKIRYRLQGYVAGVTLTNPLAYLLPFD